MAGTRIRWTHDQARAVMIAAGAEPLEPFVRAREPWPCRCTTCANTVAPTLDHVRAGQAACKYCARRLSPEDAVGRMLAIGLWPVEPYPGSHSLWRSVCMVCGAALAVRYANVVTRGQPGCRQCAATPDRGEVAVQVMRAASLKPLAPYPGTNKPWASVCLGCSHQSTPRYANVRRGRSCRYCAATGVDHTAPATVCVAHHGERRVVGVGIASGPPRLAAGWDVGGAVALATGAEAFAVQQAVLQRWRWQGAAAAPSAEDKAFDAWLLSFSTADVSVAQACAEAADVAEKLQHRQAANRRAP